ncbi:hypothetical protein MTBBW1_1140017 [Desulfamplus magnetovallimortis]|uniref:Uncharacterized protein n=1 Tax=Desulfamplus magnetovallimortis TaxID=1246637 RepID=A0A1W1H5V0_9BACT|nr:hypothetical protein MTBBW1_1140017 [Desulfamplus magnetovallimortis]
MLNRQFYGHWNKENLAATPPEPEKWKRYYQITVTTPKHYQFICESLTGDGHISFLHITSSSGSIIGGGEPSQTDQTTGKERTSFDLTLLPGIYCLELYSYNLPGTFAAIVLDDCTNEPERPFMYDDDGFDAFGNEKPRPLEKITLGPGQLDCDADYYGAEDPNVLRDGSIDYRNVFNHIRYITNFTWVSVNLMTPTKIKKLCVAGGNSSLTSAFNNNNTILEGRNNNNDAWSQICFLNGGMTPVAYPDWILTFAIPAPQPDFQYYRIRFEYRRSDRFITEIELYK